MKFVKLARNLAKNCLCAFCSFKSHPRCSAGKLGCKACLKDIFPGYDVSYRELFNYDNNTIFNPYSSHTDIKFVGNSQNDPDYGHLAWSNFSNLLDTCDYYNFTDIQASRNYELKVLSLNIRSLNDKISNLRENIENYSKFDVLCFNETNCNPENLPFKGDELLLENFHKPFTQSPARSSNRGGGLAIYVNKNLVSESNCKLMSNLSYNSDPQKGEFMFLEIKTKFKTIIICNMYRSPSGDVSSFLSELDTRISALRSHKNKTILFASDSNVDLLGYGHFEPATKLVTNFSEYGFAPTISRPTRVTCQTATLIDHIFINDCTAITKSGVITESISDHLAIFINILIDSHKIDYKLSNSEEELIQRCDMSDENSRKFQSEIDNTNWDFTSAEWLFLPKKNFIYSNPNLERFMIEIS